MKNSDMQYKFQKKACRSNISLSKYIDIIGAALHGLSTEHHPLTSVPGWRESHRAETNPLFRGLKFLPCEYTKLLLVCYYPSAVSPQGFGLQ